MKSTTTRTSSLPLMALRLSVATLTTLLVGSCATAAGPTKSPAYVPCQGWKPIVLDHRDVMTSKDKAQVLNHNCYGARIGCWPMPPDPKVCVS